MKKQQTHEFINFKHKFIDSGLIKDVDEISIETEDFYKVKSFDIDELVKLKCQTWVEFNNLYKDLELKVNLFNDKFFKCRKIYKFINSLKNDIDKINELYCNYSALCEILNSDVEGYVRIDYSTKVFKLEKMCCDSSIRIDWRVCSVDPFTYSFGEKYFDGNIANLFKVEFSLYNEDNPYICFPDMFQSKDDAISFIKSNFKIKDFVMDKK